ncbi:MAG: hypothetical protein QM703_06140 [Gemmatales bacterium]
MIDLLADLFDSTPTVVRVENVGGTKSYDYRISVGTHRFIAEYKSNASAGAVATAIDGLKRAIQSISERRLPLIVVPYMGPVGSQLCKQSQISWFDLCGNATIVAPGLRIRIEGRANQFKDRGRPPNVFASKSSRVTHQLLLLPQQFQTQAELARQTQLGDGYVSKIVRRLEQENYLEVNTRGAVRPRNPNLLLDAWHEVYDFNRHRILKGHVSARSGEELLQKIDKQMLREYPEWALTGLCAAWVYTHFAAFRLVTVYLPSRPSNSLLDKLGFEEEPKGANLWFVVPDDDGVFLGMRREEGGTCVSAIQTYLDLKAQPERAKDAAIELRQKLLPWGEHGN